jgi:hypothetical protein
MLAGVARAMPEPVTGRSRARHRLIAKSPDNPIIDYPIIDNPITR